MDENVPFVAVVALVAVVAFVIKKYKGTYIVK